MRDELSANDSFVLAVTGLDSLVNAVFLQLFVRVHDI
jgi:hypothetical protein